MNIEKEREKIACFIKSGLVGLSIVLLVYCGVYCVPDAVETFQTMNEEPKYPIYYVQTNEKKAALSFDTGWGNENTETILEILEKHNVKATFFLTGSWIAQYPEEVKNIVKAGHDVGNHSENHKQMSLLTAEECEEEIMSVHNKVKELTGVDMTLFRPPYGDYNNCVINSANACGYYCIEWNIDSLDWKDYKSDEILKNTVENKEFKNGSIILCHNAGKYTVEALDAMILGLQQKGYDLVPVSELIYKDGYSVEDDGGQCKEE